MASLKNIKLKILSYKKTGTVTHAMEAVSAVKMRKAQERALSGRAYAAAGLSVLERLSGAANMSLHPLMQERAGKTCIIAITSDKGLAGSLNSGVIRKVEEEIGRRNLQHKDIVMVTVGRRAGDFFTNRGFDVRERHENMSDAILESELRKVTDKIVQWRAEGQIGSCVVVYQNFISTFEQQPSARQIIPVTPAMMREMVEGIRPVRGKYAPPVRESENAPSTYTVEPDIDTVFSILLPRLLNMAIFHAVLENKASEHSARMVAMKSATDKAKEMAQDLTRTFNKVRQASITREVSEITSGIEAMR